MFFVALCVYSFVTPGKRTGWQFRTPVYSQRSDVYIGLVKTIAKHFEKFGARVTKEGNYPGWTPNKDSAIYQTMENQYKTLFNKKPKSMVIHAGLECGLFSDKYPNWDMISFGPTINFPHSPDEKVEIESVDKYWALLKATLKAID